MDPAVRHHRFTVEEYRRMGEAGILADDDRVELIDGEIIEMSPIGSRHAACVNKLTRLLVQQVGERAIVSVQNPVEVADNSEPQPDLTLLRSRPDFYAERHPLSGDVLLMIEVADTSLRFDLTVKAPLYARTGVPELWIVDLSRERVHVFRDREGGAYRTAEIVERRATLGLPAPCPGQLRVEDVLP
jgi:Uma2 family endonuclease